MNVWFKACLIRSISYLSFLANIISSTYTNNIVKDPLEELMNSEWSFIDWVYPIKSKKDDSLANHSMLACLRPYKAFFNLQTCLGWIEVNLGEATKYTSSFNSQSKNALFMSNYLIPNYR